MLRSQKIIFQLVGAFIFIGILIFIYLGYARYRTGPQISTINLQKFTETQQASLRLKIELKNTQSVSINGREMLIKNGNTVDEILVFSPGDNIINIGLTDSLGKHRNYEYHIFYKAPKQEYPYNLKDAQKEREQEKEETENTLPA